jgi:hypothetical protein
MYIHTHPSFVGFFIEKTLVFVFEEKNRMFLKAYALVSIEPGLTHILNYIIMYFTHTFKIFFDHNIDENVYIYIYICTYFTGFL